MMSSSSISYLDLYCFSLAPNLDRCVGARVCVSGCGGACVCVVGGGMRPLVRWSAATCISVTHISLLVCDVDIR